MVTRELAADRRYGLGRSLLPVVEGLQQRGWEVRYLSQQDLSTKQIEARKRWLSILTPWLPFLQLPSRQALLAAWLERLAMGWYAASVAKQKNYNRVHLHDPWMAIGFYWAARLMKLNDVRWGITEHGYGSYSTATHQDGLIQGPRLQRLFRQWEAFILNKADWVVCPTDLAIAALERDLCLPSKPAHWHKISHARPTLKLTSRKQARKQLAWSEGSIYVLGVGRIVPLKRFELMLTACINLAAKCPNLYLCILGEGSVQPLIAQASKAGFSDRLIMTSTDDVGLYFSAADIYINTSSSESFGLANLEALSSGLPVLSVATAAVPEVMGDGAWLVSSQEHALTSSLGTLIEDNSLQKFWSMRGLAHARQWPNANQVTDQYVALYSSK